MKTASGALRTNLVTLWNVSRVKCELELEIVHLHPPLLAINASISRLLVLPPRSELPGQLTLRTGHFEKDVVESAISPSANGSPLYVEFESMP